MSGIFYAWRALGWTEIDALVIGDMGHLQAELIEIDENLCRAELSTTQRSKYMKRRRQIWEAMHPAERVVKAESKSCEQVAQVAPPVAKHGHLQDKAFASNTAAITGESKSQINRHLARAEALGDTLLDRITGE